MKIFLKIGLSLLIIVILFFFFVRHPVNQAVEHKKMRIQAVLGNNENKGRYKKAFQPISFSFPEDAGPHPEFKSEWWYYTGNLQNSEGAEFGYQFTIFRQSISDHQLTSSSAWRTNQIYMAHLALTDIKNAQFYSFSKMTRGSVGLAGAELKPFRIWVENWSISGQHDNPVLKASTKDFVIELQLKALKPVVLNGNQGLSQKSQGIGNASYYYSQTRIKTDGELTIKGNKKTVSGFSWFDREWSTSSLGKTEVGWDWFSIQLQNNRELMLYNIRQKDGQTSSLSSGTFIKPDGSYVHLKKADFAIEVMDFWKSDATGISYPSKWHIKIPKFKINLFLVPKISNQEHQHQFVYWEGATTVLAAGLKGNGYVELVGYR